MCCHLSFSAGGSIKQDKWTKQSHTYKYFSEMLYSEFYVMVSCTLYMCIQYMCVWCHAVCICVYGTCENILCTCGYS